MDNTSQLPAIPTGIAPFLVVRNGSAAIDFYIKAFGATETYKFTAPDGKVVAQISLEGAAFWLGDEEVEFDNLSPESIGGSPVRIVITVTDPVPLFARAIAAGATEICPVTMEHDWQIGKLRDPFGHVWEIGRPLS